MSQRFTELHLVGSHHGCDRTGDRLVVDLRVLLLDLQAESTATVAVDREHLEVVADIVRIIDLSHSANHLFAELREGGRSLFVPLHGDVFDLPLGRFR